MGKPPSWSSSSSSPSSSSSSPSSSSSSSSPSSSQNEINDIASAQRQQQRLLPRQLSARVVEAQRTWYAVLEARLMSEGPLYTVLLTFVLVNAALFWYGVVLQARLEQNFMRYTTVIARGCGFMMNLDVGLLLLVASRSFMTLLRSTPLNMLIPFDVLMPGAHIVLGYTIFVAAVLHGIFHTVPGIILHLWAPGFLHWTYAVTTGCIIMTSLTVMVVYARKSVRRDNFELFYYVHLTGAAFFCGLLCFHGILFAKLYAWKWVSPFIVIYVLDRLSRALREWRVFVRISDSDPSAYSRGTVTKFVIPKCLNYRAGQFAEICIPALSEHQWHPFTIASAPGEQHMTFFIKASGNWTRALGQLLSEKSNMAPQQGEEFALQPDSPESREIMCRVRGPYGSPAQHVGQFDKVVLISGGVGSTPYLSVVKDIVQHLDDECNRLRTVESVASTADSSCDLLDGSYHELSSSNPDGKMDESSPQSAPAQKETCQKPIHTAETRTVRASILLGALYISNLERLYNFLSSTTLAFFVFWIEIIRLFLTTLAFAVNQDTSVTSFQGLQVLPFGFQIADLVLATLIAVPTAALIAFELFYVQDESSLIFKGVDLLIVFPTLMTPVLTSIMFFCFSLNTGSSYFQTLYYFVLWPVTIAVVVFRHVRNRAGTTVLASKRRSSYDHIRSVDFVYTTPDGVSDDWLVADITPYCSSKHFRLHRYLTRETADVEMGREQVGLFPSSRGRPDWNTLVDDVVQNAKSGSSIGVFFCGPKPMEREVRDACHSAMVRSRRRGMQYGTGTGRQQAPTSHHSSRGCNIRLALRVEHFS